MIISEIQVKVPSRKYSLAVNCTRTRRLTAIEWLLLTCIAKFHSSETMSGRTIKSAFEQVFDIQDSNLLIKPCVESLRKLGVLSILGDDFDYNRAKFNSVELTPLGEEMLQNGLLPGENTVFSTTVWFNPLTEQINSQEGKKSSFSPISFGSKEIFGDIFPVDIIKEKLQSGEVSAGKYIASEYRINSVEAVDSMDAETYITLRIFLDEDNAITISPAIQNEVMKSRVEELFFGNGLSKECMEKLLPIKKTDVREILGTGIKIDHAIRDICRNGSFLLIDEWLYSYFLEKMPELFEGKRIILFNSKRFASRKDNNGYVLSLPFSFCIDGCVAINNRNDNLCIGKKSAEFEATRLEFPLAYSSAKINRRNDIVISWLESETIQAAKKDLSYLSLFGFGLMNRDEMDRYLNTLWATKSIDVILSDIEKISRSCNEKQIEMVNLSGEYPLIERKLEATKDAGFRLSKTQAFVSSAGIEKGSAFHVQLVKKVLQYTNKPQKYDELKKLQDKFGIENHDTALKFDELMNPLYDYSVISSMVASLMEGRNPVSREFFAFDEFFSSYSTIIESIRLLVDHFDLFKTNDAVRLRKVVKVAPNLAKLHSSILQLREKNSQLIDFDINIYSLMKSIDATKAECFFSNLDVIEKAVVDRIAGIDPSDKVNPQSKNEPIEHIDEKVYVVDTCALINCPEILHSFGPDEYVRTPAQVMIELGKIKDRRSPRAYADNAPSVARKLVEEIDYDLDNFTFSNDLIILSEDAHQDLLPPDLDPDTYDHLILSVAFAYKKWNVTLITDDKQFALVAKHYEVNTISGRQFMEFHKKFYTEGKELTEKKYESLIAPSAAVINFHHTMGKKRLEERQ